MSTPETQTPRTDEAIIICGSLSQLHHVSADFARQLERELNDAVAIIEGAKDALGIKPDEMLILNLMKFQADRDQWKAKAEERLAMAQELAAKLEAAAHTFRMRFASNVDTLKTTPTPYDKSLSRFNAMNKCHHGIRDTATNLPYCRKCDEEGLK